MSEEARLVIDALAVILTITLGLLAPLLQPHALLLLAAMAYYVYRRAKHYAERVRSKRSSAG
ncbi:MAG: hypothetical protein QXM08_03625 [Thermofilaceae archaeon]